MSDLRRCSRCGEFKPFSEYYRNSRGRDGLMSDCKACGTVRAKEWREANAEHEAARSAAYRRAHVERRTTVKNAWRKANPGKAARWDRTKSLRRYGLTPEKYDAMLAAQGGGCAICGDTSGSWQGFFGVDHDHSCCPRNGSCGRCVRGLLCDACNRAIGLLRDNADLALAAAAYLRNPPAVASRLAEGEAVAADLMCDPCIATDVWVDAVATRVSGMHRAEDLDRLPTVLAALAPDATIQMPCVQSTRHEVHGSHTRHVDAYTRYCLGYCWDAPTAQMAVTS